MKIRIRGTEEDCKKFTEDMENYYEVIYVSEWQKDTRKVQKSKEGRVYLEMNMTYIDKNGSVKKI